MEIRGPQLDSFLVAEGALPLAEEFAADMLECAWYTVGA